MILLLPLRFISSDLYKVQVISWPETGSSVSLPHPGPSSSCQCPPRCRRTLSLVCLRELCTSWLFNQTVELKGWMDKGQLLTIPFSFLNLYACCSRKGTNSWESGIFRLYCDWGMKGLSSKGLVYQRNLACFYIWGLHFLANLLESRTLGPLDPLFFFPQPLCRPCCNRKGTHSWASQECAFTAWDTMLSWKRLYSRGPDSWRIQG